MTSITNSTGVEHMASKAKQIRVRKTPNCLHPYTATLKGTGTYGWGHTAAEARDCLNRRLAEQVSA